MGLRERLRQKRIVVAPAIFDALTGLVTERAGADPGGRPRAGARAPAPAPERRGGRALPMLSHGRGLWPTLRVDRPEIV